MRMMHEPHRTERGFTIVEVIIAAVIVTALFAGAIYFMVGAGKSQESTLVRQRMAATADAVSQQVRSDRRWLDKRIRTDDDCSNLKRTEPCDISSDFASVKSAGGSSGGPALETTVLVMPIDSDTDLKGDADQDGVKPDFYRIDIAVDLATPEDHKAYPGLKPFTTSSTVDATALGRASGAITVEVGETTNQVDERMPIGNVTDNASNLEMSKQPQDPGACTQEALPFSQWMSNDRSIFKLGCNRAWNSARNKDASLVSVRAREVSGVKFRLVSQAAGGKTYRSKDMTVQGGTFSMGGIPAGTYRIVVDQMPANRELWPSKVVPSNRIVSVQSNQEARALIMLRPKQGTGEYRVRLTRDIYKYTLDTFTKTLTDTHSTPHKDRVIVTKTYTVSTYLRAEGPKREKWSGPAWSGFLSMEPKPYDRYRSSYGNEVARFQPVLTLIWQPLNYDKVQGENHNGIWTFTGLPTGLHSSVFQMPAPSPDTSDPAWGLRGKWGRFDADLKETGRNGTRNQTCIASLTPGGQCSNDFVWLSAEQGSNGKANGMLNLHSPAGECYVRSSTSAYKLSPPLQLQLDGTHANRCSRTFRYRNPETGKIKLIKDFFPNLRGEGGKTMLLSVRQWTVCVSGCSGGSNGSMGYGSGDDDDVTPNDDPPKDPDPQKVDPIKGTDDEGDPFVAPAADTTAPEVTGGGGSNCIKGINC